MRKIAVATCAVTCFLSASIAFAGMVNLAANDSGTVTADTGQLTTFERFNDPSTGTGVFEPFVRIQAKGMEIGYNTDGIPEFNTKKGRWTHAIKLGDIMIINGNIEFLLDINESQAKAKRYLSLDTLQIFLSDKADNDDYASGLGTLVYSLNAENNYDNWVKLDNTIFGPGSGTGDMRVLIPVSSDWLSGQYGEYLYLYSEFGRHLPSTSNAGFEEWSAMLNPAPEPATLAILGLGALMLRKRK